MSRKTSLSRRLRNVRPEQLEDRLYLFSDTLFEIADFDGDGTRDDSVTYYESVHSQLLGELRVGLSNGASAGKWGGTVIPTMGWKWGVGDLNGDNRDDVIGYIEGRSTGELWVFLSTGDSFAVRQQWGYASLSPGWTFEIADLNADNRDDVVGFSQGETTVGLWAWLSTGTGFAVPQLWSTAGPSSGWTFEIADFNADNRDDVVGFFQGETMVGLWTWLSTGTAFTVPERWNTAGPPAGWTWQVGDVNADNYDDVVGFFQGETMVGLWTWLSTGTTFTVPQRWSTAGPPAGWTWQMGDVNGDSLNDVVGFYQSARTVEFWTWLSTGTTFTVPRSWGTAGPQAGWTWRIANAYGENYEDVVGRHYSLISDVVWTFPSNGNEFGFLQWPDISPVNADINRDGTVDAADAGFCFSEWGGPGLCDLNKDGVVDAADMGEFAFPQWTGDASYVGTLASPLVAARERRRFERNKAGNTDMAFIDWH